MQEIGACIKVIFKSLSQDLIIVSHKEEIFCNQNYIIYNFSTGHVLYVKDTFTLPQQINIEGRLIDSVKEIKGGDFYLKLNSKSALPL